MKGAAAGLSATWLSPVWSRSASAQSASDPVLVVIFLRGGADGLSLVIPRGDPAYNTTLRPDIYVPPTPANLLGPDDFFELHPAMGALKPMYDGTGSAPLSVVHACGNTGTYSHFEAQDAMERVAPYDPGAIDGWLHKAANALIDTEQPPQGTVLSLYGVSLSATKTASLAGSGRSVSIAFPSVGAFRFEGSDASLRRDTLSQIYADLPEGLTPDRGKDRMQVTGAELFDSLDALATLPAASTQLYGGVAGNLASSLRDAARLIKGDIGVRTLAFDYGGWDHHRNLSAAIASQGASLAIGLRDFYEDLGAAHSGRTVTLVVTEFGRTARQNGTQGTEHGWGTTMLAAGGGIRGGEVLTRPAVQTLTPGYPLSDGQVWPGIGPGQLHKQLGSTEVQIPGYEIGERDLKSTTDFRDVFGEVLIEHMRLPPDTVRDDVMGGDHTPVLSGLFT